MTLPKPETVSSDLREIERVLPSIRELYCHPERGAYEVALSAHGNSSLDGGSRPGFSDSDPTGNIAADRLKAHQRRTVRKAAGKVMAAMEELYAARNDLERVVGPLQVQIARTRASNSPLSDDEFKATLEAQQRREARECRICGSTVVFRDGRCDGCYRFRRQHGRDRTFDELRPMLQERLQREQKRALTRQILGS